MIKLHDLLKEIKDENLSKEQLEDYFTMSCQLRTEISLALGKKQKEEALFMLGANPTHAYVCRISKYLKGETADEVMPKCTCDFKEKSVAQRKLEWKASESGQRLIELKSYAIAIKSALEGLKNRIYAKL